MIVTFTDFGIEGPYLGQVKAVFHRLAPGMPVVDLVADAPPFDAQSSAYLLAALAPEFPEGAVFFCVVDPGVGGARSPLVVEVDGRWFVGPDNGLFEPLARRAGQMSAWEILWRPDRLTATFHGRDLFAPVAARLASGERPESIGCRPCLPTPHPDWPDDLAAVIYLDRYGNALTGIRAATVPAGTALEIGGRRIPHARTFGDVQPGEALWYEGSSGLIEIAVNCGRADNILNLGVGASFRLTA